MKVNKYALILIIAIPIVSLILSIKHNNKEAATIATLFLMNTIALSATLLFHERENTPKAKPKTTPPTTHVLPESVPNFKPHPLRPTLSDIAQYPVFSLSPEQSLKNEFYYLHPCPQCNNHIIMIISHKGKYFALCNSCYYTHSEIPLHTISKFILPLSPTTPFPTPADLPTHIPKTSRLRMELLLSTENPKEVR